MDRLGIYPWPQWLERRGGTWSVPQAGITLWLGETCRPIADGVVPLLATQGLTTHLGENVASAGVVVGGLHEPEVAERLRGHAELLAQPLPPEGYVLVVDAAGVTVGGADARGCLYGLSAFASLWAQHGPSGHLPFVEVRDWPYKPMRGAHVYMPGREDLPFFRRLLALMASLRYNLLYLEVGGGMRFDRHPEVNEAWARFCDEAHAYPGGPQALQQSQPYPKDSTHVELAGGRWLEKEEVAEIIRYANSLGIEVTPELQSLSHAYYMALAHPEIAERTWDPWPDTYCPSNPRSYELYFDLLDEVIEVFQPRMVHIGHDEVYTIGLCDRCRGKSGAELLAGDLRRIRDYLHARGIRTVLWGDKLQNIIVGGVDHGGRVRRYVSSERKADHAMRETYQAVDFVPKDMLIMDWYWCLDPSSEQFFRRKGFEVIFGNFGNNFEPQTFYQWDKRAAGNDVLGAEVSTWCHAGEYAFGHNLTFFNLLFSANMLWWSHYSDRERELTLGEVARLQPVARRAMSGCLRPTAASATPLAVGSVECPLADSIAVGRKASELVFLHHCCSDREPQPTWSFADFRGKDEYNLLGHYLVGYADGTSEAVEIRYGDNIARLDLTFGEHQASTPFWAEPVSQGRDREGKRVTFWSHTWTNPRPEVEIVAVAVNPDRCEEGERIVLVSLAALPL